MSVEINEPLYTEEDFGMRHIWGIKSWDDLSKCECNFFTMNDFDITLNVDTNKYIFGVETIYCFEDRKSQNEYIFYIFNKLTEWMKSQGYNTETEYDIYEVFTENLSQVDFEAGFDTIEDLYKAFKFLVYGFTGEHISQKSDI